jgi:CRP-like cAMP-binding protein
MIPENPVLAALLFGFLAAVSLPLGALAAEIWRPGPRMLAFFMAFGGGALIAALAIELLVPAVHGGHILVFSAGTLAGGLLFKLLNALLNRSGGYLRKSATAAQFWKGKAESRWRDIVARLRRVDLTADMPDEVIDGLLPLVVLREFPEGMPIYRQLDPPGNLYVIEEGRVDLLDPMQGFRTFEQLREYDAFGRMSFLTGLPRATEAVARSKVRLLVIPREPFMEVVESLPALRARLAQRLAGVETRRYLKERYGFSDRAIHDWLEEATKNLETQGRYDSPEVPRHGEREVEALFREAGRTTLFRRLPEPSLRAMALQAVPRKASQGFTFFRPGQLADRMYLLAAGRVALIDPAAPAGHATPLCAGDAFGADAFITEGAHTTTAVALDDCEVYALRRKDFDALLDRDTDLRRAVAEFLQDEHIHAYLTGPQKLAGDKAARWMEKAALGLESAALYPSLAELKQEAGSHGNVALAIFLGLLLDGIPESLVIGADLVQEAAPGLAMIGGVLVSNFPEALSSAAGMRAQGMSRTRVVAMWSGVLVVAGVSAMIGALALGGAPPDVFSFVEGVAGGAMLIVVAETLLPEAFEKGGSIVGMSTLLGFIVASLLGSIH